MKKFFIERLILELLFGKGRNYIGGMLCIVVLLNVQKQRKDESDIFMTGERKEIDPNTIWPQGKCNAGTKCMQGID